MIALAGTVAIIMAVVLITKMARTPGPIPVATLLVLALAEVALVFYYMYSLETPVP